MEEKKVSKISQFYKKFKELYKIPRYRALITLGLYFAFFVIIIATINSARTEIIDENNEIPISLRNFKEMSNYEYTYKIEQNIDEEIIYYNGIGKYTLENETFTIENDINTYYIKNNDIYIIKDNLEEKVDNPLPINLLILKPHNITDFLLTSTLQTTTTDHQQNIIKKTYLLSLKDFIKLYLNEEIDNIEDFISITATEKNDNIIQIEIDLSNVILSEYSINFKKIEFNYQNISNNEIIE